MRSPALFLVLAGACGGGPAPAPPADGRSPDQGGETAGGGDLAGEWTTKGLAAYREGNVDRAKGAFDRALTLAPDDARAKVGMSLVHMARLEFALAARRLEGVDDPSAPPLRVMAAWLGGDLPTACAAAAELGGGRGAQGLVASLCREPPSQPYRLEGAQQASLPLATNSPLPLVVATVDGRTARLLVDTGAAETILDREFAGAGETKWIRELGLSTISMHDVPAFVRDLAPLSRGLQTDVDGILGLEVLRRLFTTLDYGEGWMLLRRDRSDAGPDATSVPFHLFMGRYLSIPLGLEGRPPVPALVANGGTFAVGLTDTALRATGRDPDALTREPDGMARYGLRSVEIGTLSVTDVPAVHPVFPTQVIEDSKVDFGAVISQQLLAGFRITLDPERRVMAFEPGPEQPPGE